MPSDFRIACPIAVLALIAASCIAAAAEGDPCGSTAPAQVERWRAGIDEDVAVYVAKHVQRACRRLAAYPAIDPDDPRAKEAEARVRALVGDLNGRFLEAVYTRFAHLRGQDLTARAVPSLEGNDAAKEQGTDRRVGMTIRPGAIDRESAEQLVHGMDAIAKSFFPLVTDLGKEASRDKRKALIEESFDIIAELGFADDPGYAAFPELWRERMRRRPENIGRTAESDAQFCKTSAAARAVRFTRPAKARLRAVLASIEEETGSSDHVVAVSWMLGGRFKGPKDAEAKRLPPGISVGTYYREQLPPDVIRRIGRIPVVVTDETPPRLAGRTIDFRDGRFRLVDR